MELAYCGSAVQEYLASRVRADVVLLDLMMEDGSSPEANVAGICRTGARVLVVSTHADAAGRLPECEYEYEYEVPGAGSNNAPDRPGKR